MAEDEDIRALLASLPPASLARTPPGFIALSRTAVQAEAEEAGLDPATVIDWIAGERGRLVHPPPMQSQGMRAGRRVARTVPAEPYFVLPVAALRRPVEGAD